MKRKSRDQEIKRSEEDKQRSEDREVKASDEE
jgi:hypothetical protein